MMVGGGAVPATSLTRQEVQRPRPPQMALMSTPPACAALRMVVPGLVSRMRGPGRIVTEIVMRAQDIILFLDFPRVFADSYLLTRRRVWRALLLGGALLRYVVYRLLWLVPTLLAMALVTFLVMHATPGSPLDPVAEGANPLSPDGQKALAAYYGLDKPLWEQFAIFVGKAVRGDFGFSFVYKTRTVAEILRETFPVSLFLGSMALVLAVVGALTPAVPAAIHQNRGWDYVSVSLATLPAPIPTPLLPLFLST